jgi:cilia- and flagella-associated protein 44
MAAEADGPPPDPGAPAAQCAAATAPGGDWSAAARVLGVDVGRRNGLAALDADTVALAAGNAVLLLHLPTMGQRLLPTRDGGGVGAIAVHPRGTCFAVAEKCAERAPNM